MKGPLELDPDAERETVLREALAADQALVVEEARATLGHHEGHADAEAEEVGVHRIAIDREGRAGRIVQEARLDLGRIALELVLPLELEVRNQHAPAGAVGIGELAAERAG